MCNQEMRMLYNSFRDSFQLSRPSAQANPFDRAGFALFSTVSLKSAVASGSVSFRLMNKHPGMKART